MGLPQQPGGYDTFIEKSQLADSRAALPAE